MDFKKAFLVFTCSLLGCTQVQTLGVKPKEQVIPAQLPNDSQIENTQKRIFMAVEKAPNTDKYTLLIENKDTEDLWLSAFTLQVKSKEGYIYGDVQLSRDGVPLVNETQNSYSQGKFPSNPTIFDKDSQEKGYDGPLDFDGLKLIIPRGSKTSITLTFVAPNNLVSEVHLSSYTVIGSNTGLLSSYQNPEINNIPPLEGKVSE